MDAYWDNVFSLLLEGDKKCAEASGKAARQAEGAHRRLVELAGEAEGEKIWETAALMGCAEVLPAFRAGLRFGLRLLALCMEGD